MPDKHAGRSACHGCRPREWELETEVMGMLWVVYRFSWGIDWGDTIDR